MKSNAIYLRFRITLFYFIILFFSSLVSAQEKGIILKDKKIGEIEFLRENKRIKVVTSDGNHFIGRFKIIDDKTIEIDDEKILLDSIIMIKRRSVTSAIIETTFYVLGGTIVAACIAAASTNPIILILIPISFPFVITAALVPALESNHKVKRWHYSIGSDESKTE